MSRLFAPVDVAGLVMFRVAFGLLMAWEAARYLFSGWVQRDFVAPDFHFRFPGFGWVPPPPDEWMTPLFVGLGALGLAVAAGAAYRLAAGAFFVGFTWLFLVEPAYYLNHLYLVCLLSFLLPWMPLHRASSVDAALRGWPRVDRMSGWPLHLLRGTFALVYFYAGLAKLNADWLRAQPLLVFLEARRDVPVLGPLLAADATAWFMSYAGLAFDLAVGPALLWRRSRPYALVGAFAFHLCNALLFEIGIFPWMMMAATLLFCDPSWPRRLGLFPAVRHGDAAPPGPRVQRALAWGIAAWLLVHAVVPLRHWLYPGDVAWTEEGHRFSWRMKLRFKDGRARFRLLDPVTDERWIVDPRERLPYRLAEAMATRPDLVHQYARHLADEARAAGHTGVAVYADVQVRLNGRPPARLVDPRADLAARPATLGPADWILPLDTPLPGWDW